MLAAVPIAVVNTAAIVTTVLLVVVVVVVVFFIIVVVTVATVVVVVVIVVVVVEGIAARDATSKSFRTINFLSISERNEKSPLNQSLESFKNRMDALKS